MTFLLAGLILVNPQCGVTHLYLIMVVVFGAIVVACLWYMWEIIQA